MDHQSSYRQIFKATSIFGGVQAFNIIIGIIRSKAAALFLGTEGMGIVGLFNTTLELVRSITGLGINVSAVRDISEANSDENSRNVSEVITVVRRLCLFTGILGMAGVIVLSPWLSRWTFGSNDYTLSFVFLSVVPLFTSLSFGQLAVMQGLRKITYLAKANLYGGAISLLFLIPFYWIWGVKGIVPLLIVAAIITYCCTYYFARKVAIRNVLLNWKTVYVQGKGMVVLGVMLMMSSFFGVLVAYILRIFISKEGNLSEVGLYTAAFTLIDTYTGLVFTAMGTDFYPRLSAINKDNQEMTKLINCQAEIGVMILAPMVIVFMLFAPFILTLLYSSKFVPVTSMLQWAMLGILLKATSWPLAFSLLAKAKNKLFLIKEIASGIYYLGLSILGYKLWGLTGLGIGFLLAYICNLLQILLINKILYRITLSSDFYKVFVPQLLITIIAFVVIYFVNEVWVIYSVGILILVLSCLFSYRGLNRRLDIKSIIQNRFGKK